MGVIGAFAFLPMFVEERYLIFFFSAEILMLEYIFLDVVWVRALSFTWWNKSIWLCAFIKRFCDCWPFQNHRWIWKYHLFSILNEFYVHLTLLFFCQLLYWCVLFCPVLWSHLFWSTFAWCVLQFLVNSVVCVYAWLVYQYPVITLVYALLIL